MGLIGKYPVINHQSVQIKREISLQRSWGTIELQHKLYRPNFTFLRKRRRISVLQLLIFLLHLCIVGLIKTGVDTLNDGDKWAN